MSPVAHHGDPVRELHRLGLVVRHVQRGEAELPLHGQQLEAQLLPYLGVDVRERLVEQDEVAAGDERARERDPLLLPAAHLAGVLPLELGDPHEVEDAPDALRDLLLLDPPTLERIGDVLEGRHVRPERVGLEDHREPAPFGRNVDAA